MNIEELFQKYKNISLAVISAVENDNMDSMDELVSERGKVLKLISEIDVEKKELKKLYEKYDLFSLDRKINEKFQQEMDDLKQKIRRVKISKEASKSYNSVNAKSVFLSRKM
ncbi:flagellar protein FliT [Clostridium sp. LBM24168]